MAKQASSESSDEREAEAFDLSPTEQTSLYLSFVLEVYGEYLSTLGPNVTEAFIDESNRDMANLVYHLNQAEFFARRLYTIPPRI